MSDPADKLNPETSQGKPTILAALLTWVVIQMVALLLSVLRVRLWARGAQPVEQFALQLMVAFQVGTSALLFPWLMRDARASVWIILSAAPFVWLAGLLAGKTGARIAETVAVVLVWLIALAIWSSLLRDRTARLIGVAVASSLTVGGSCAVYLCVEFADASLNFHVILWVALAVVLAGAVIGTLICWR